VSLRKALFKDSVEGFFKWFIYKLKSVFILLLDSYKSMQIQTASYIASSAKCPCRILHFTNYKSPAIITLFTIAYQNFWRHDISASS